ncbi:transposase IS4 domain-containing protein [Phthorimaea operculella]|nr:transposase IS4 domain-containing protein [Phthorimaea operculella]
MLGPKKKSKTLQAESDCSSETGSASEESSIITNSSTEKDSACSDANVEFVGVSPQSSSRISPAPAIQHLDPLDDDDDDAVERWVQSVDTNPGSDTEDNDINESTSNHNENFRSALGCPADIENYLNQETCNDLNEIDMRADAELREIAADTDLLSFEWSNDPNVFTGKRETFTALDESLLLWKGKLSFAQMISNKAAKVGIKSYELCESRTGYLWSFLIYGGKKYAGCTKFASDIDEPERATAKIVYTLVRPLLNRGHTLVMDNFYNAPLLTRMLKKEKTDTMGTLRLNREFVPHSLKAIKKTDFRVGEVAFSHAKDMTILVWRDSNLVSLISSYHKIEVSGKEKHGIYRHKPQVVLDYNLSMGGVDKKDQMLQAFPIERVRNVVWYKKLFRRLFNVSIYNAYVIYNATRNNVSQRKFRVQLADEILKKFGQPVKVTPNAPRILEGHFPTKGKSSKATCKVCYKKKRDTRTAYQCDNCKVALCIIGCFREFHTLTENDLRRNSDEVGFLRL